MEQEVLDRVAEVEFINYIDKIIHKCPNPIKIYEYIESICEITGVSKLTINSVVATILSGDKKYRASKEEIYSICTKLDLPVRQRCKLMGMSNSTYYKAMRNKSMDVPVYPRYAERQNTAIKDFMKAVDYLSIERML